MKILVTGATGFTGKRVLQELKKNSDVNVLCLARSKEASTNIEKLGFSAVMGNVEDKDTLIKAFKGIDILINIVSLGFGHADNIVGAAEEAGVKRAVFVSTTAIETKLNAKSKVVRKAAEKRIHESDLDWTIIRPTMIYGFPDDRNMIRLLKFLSFSPLVIVPGKGDFLQHPVHVCDVAKAIVAAAISARTIKKTYNVSGKEAITFNNLIKTAAKSLGKKVFIIHFPEKPVLWFFRLLEKMIKKPFLKKEQVERLLEDKNFPHDEAFNDFSYSPRSFQEGISLEVEYFRKK